jgi:hypothetical protein
MTRLLFAGRHVSTTQTADKPFTLSFTDKAIRFNDYNSHELPLVYTVPMLDIFTPIYCTGKDNSDQPYEMLDWTASMAWHEPGTDSWHCSRLNIQTWNRETFFLWARFPHRRYNNRIWPVEHTAELIVFDLDTASRRRFLHFMDSLKKQKEAESD